MLLDNQGEGFIREMQILLACFQILLSSLCIFLAAANPFIHLYGLFNVPHYFLEGKFISILETPVGL